MKGKKVEFLFFSQEDMIQVGVLDMHKCVDVMDETFKLLGKGDYIMGGPSGNTHGIRLWFPKLARGPHMPVAGPDRRFMCIIAYLGGEFNVCGEKWYGSNIENPSKHGVPRSILLIILNDSVTGEPLAIMDGNLISAMRTGSVIGLGAKYLARQRAEIAGIVAAGIISRTSLWALAVVLNNLREVKVFDIMESKSKAFSEEMSERLGINVHPVDSLEEAIVGSDVISSAASGEKAPSIKADWLKEGSFLALSARTELPEEYFLTSKIVADNWKMHMDYRLEIGSLPEGTPGSIPFSIVHNLIRANKMKDEEIIELGQVVLGTTKGRTDDKEKIILLADGMAIEDVAWAYTIYKEALKKGIGQKLTLWNEPYWF